MSETGCTCAPDTYEPHQPWCGVAAGGTQAHELVGTVRYMRSQDVSDPPCLCCDGGPHIFAYGFDIEPNDLLDSLPAHMRDVQGWLHRVKGRVPDGSRLRLTVEVVEPPLDSRGILNV